MTKGVPWGIGVWTASYLGILPALHILKPATRHPARRNALMLAVHVVWGVGVGLTAVTLFSSMTPFMNSGPRVLVDPAPDAL